MALRGLLSFAVPACRLTASFGRTSTKPEFCISKLSCVLSNIQITRGKSYRQNQPRRMWITPERPAYLDDRLTEENVSFLQDVIKDTYKSPLREPPPERQPWTPKTQRSGLICKKIGVIPQWTKQGKRILTTMLQVVDNHVVSSSTPEQFLEQHRAHKYPIARRRLGNMVVGAESIDPTNLTDEYVQLFEESGVQPKRKLTKFVVTEDALLQPGTALHASHFRVGDYLDIGGKTMDRGFQGVMVRWGFKGGPHDYHGSTKFHRRPGSIGFSRKGKVRKGKRLPGHMGNDYRVHRSVQIVRINTKYDVIYVKGAAVQGATGAWLYLWDSHVATKKPYKNPPPMPTHFPEDEAKPVAEDIIHPDLFQFDGPTVIFEVTEDDLKQKRTGAKTAQKSPGKAPPKAANSGATSKPAAKA